MKFLSRTLIALVTIMMAFTSTVTAFASENNAVEILRAAGYEDYFIDELSDEELSEYADKITNDPASVGKEEFVFEVDNISEIQEFVNTSKEVLIAQGVTTDQIDSMQKDIDYIANSSPKELSDQYGVSSVEAKMLIEATQEDDEYKRLDCSNDNIATASGSISSSKLSFTMSYTNRGTSTPSYNFTIAYNWKSPYVTQIYKDAIAVAWAGGFVSDYLSSSANYYRGTVLQGWITNSPVMMFDKNGNAKKTNYVTYPWSSEKEPNKGIKFFVNQSRSVYQNTTASNKSGNVKFRLTSNTTGGKNQTCEVVAQFAHRRFAVTPSIGISTSGLTASLSINSAYDKSDQKDVKIKN